MKTPPLSLKDIDTALLSASDFRFSCAVDRLFEANEHNWSEEQVDAFFKKYCTCCGEWSIFDCDCDVVPVTLNSIRPAQPGSDPRHYVNEFAAPEHHFDTEHLSLVTTFSNEPPRDTWVVNNVDVLSDAELMSWKPLSTTAYLLDDDVLDHHIEAH